MSPSQGGNRTCDLADNIGFGGKLLKSGAHPNSGKNVKPGDRRDVF
jgi:hypothetical protein